MRPNSSLIAVSLAYLLAASLPLVAAAQTIQVGKDNRTLAITATDSVTTMADVATVHVGFIAYGPDQPAAYAAGSTLSNAIVRAITASGIPADQVESENQAVSPVPEYEQQQLSATERAQRQFQVVQSWTVRTTADSAAQVLDRAVQAGANQSGQIEWSLKDANAVQAEAAGHALAAARRQATAMATALGVHLGPLLYATNQVEEQPVRPVFAAKARLGAAPAPLPLAINPRRINTSATVYAVFAIE
ncbi:MAG: SIMPL domain-containing protein [Acidobacteriota bacterium]|nr:SIMPL domain-containing protein [Acidobacteriota bacterium]